MNRFAVLLATVGGAGYAPFAPGTVGSAIGVVVYLLVSRQSVGVELALLVVVTLVGVWAADRAIGHFRRKDPSPVVIDEVAGQLVTLAFTGAGLRGAVAGFLLFRLFDIIKPWPANKFEALPGGTGIVADDLMAGVYANLILQLTIRLAPAVM